MGNFVNRNSIVRKIWGSPDPILLIFAGSAAEFALNRAVDWLFFTNEIPRDPIGRLFSTVSYSQNIVFADDESAQATLDRICAVHGSVESARGQTIPDWAYRDVLYMLIDYSERAYRALYRPLTKAEQQEVFTVFCRLGEGLHIPDLPSTYAEWKIDRKRHLERDLAYSPYTSRLFKAYRRHLGPWRYRLLLEVQALLVPGRVRQLLHFNSNGLLSYLIWSYGIVDQLQLQWLVHRLLIPPQYWRDIEKFERI
jgi:hypothetical protein